MVFCEEVSCHVHQLVHGYPGLADQHDIVGEEEGGDVDVVKRDTKVGLVELRPKSIYKNGK